MLDVGCSVGLMMKPFLKNGWKCMGNDPIKAYAEWGKDKYGLPVDWMQSENMLLKKIKNKQLFLKILFFNFCEIFWFRFSLQKSEDKLSENLFLFF